jgi:hypothetical protein
MLVPIPVFQYIIKPHAQLEMKRRQIAEDQVALVLSSPEQMEEVRPGRNVYQSRLTLSDPPQTYLLRVFVDIDRDPAEVVTVYRTSKIQKYWR